MMETPTSLPMSEMKAKTSMKLQDEMNRAVHVVEEFLSPSLLKDSSIPMELITEAHGLVFLTIYKAGFLFTGKVGTGFVIARTSGGWSPPAFIASGGCGFGMMAGGEKVNYMVILGSRGAVKAFTRNGQLQIGSELDIAIGPIGRAAAASINIGRAGIAPNYSYSHAKGLYGGIGMASAVIFTRKKFNGQCYGTEKTVTDILSGAVSCKECLPLWVVLDQAMGVKRTYPENHPTGMNSNGIACDACKAFNSYGSSQCDACKTMLVYTVGQHSGSRKTGKLVVSNQTML